MPEKEPDTRRCVHDGRIALAKDQAKCEKEGHARSKTVRNSRRLARGTSYEKVRSFEGPAASSKVPNPFINANGS